MTADQIEKELNWERGVDYPEWGHTDVYLNTISRGYCLPEKLQRMHTGEQLQQQQID